MIIINLGFYNTFLRSYFLLFVISFCENKKDVATIRTKNKHNKTSTRWQKK